MPSVEAANEPVLTTPDLVMTMPLGLTSSTVPGALMVPAMVEGVLLVTRFRVDELAPGWRKLTVLPWPIEKVCQLMIA